MHFTTPTTTLLTLTILPTQITSLVIPTFYTPPPPAAPSPTTTDISTPSAQLNPNTNLSKRNINPPASIIDLTHRARPPEEDGVDVHPDGSHALITNLPIGPEPTKPITDIEGFNIDPAELEKVKSGGGNNVGGKDDTPVDSGGAMGPPARLKDLERNEFKKNVIRL
ncbi:hypothetical protein TWF281_006289 [Arthrobotrys megalospora]